VFLVLITFNKIAALRENEQKMPDSLEDLVGNRRAGLLLTFGLTQPQLEMQQEDCPMGLYFHIGISQNVSTTL
jgi:hypothetical protein